MRTIIIGLGGIGSDLADKICRFLNYKNGHYEVLMIDGDEYEEKNLERQSFLGFGKKSEAKFKELSKKYMNLNLNYSTNFINDDNIKNFITDGDIVLLCVDNHKTRKLVNDYVTKLNNISLISGGNELTDGNVQIYLRKEGKKLTPSLTDYHPEIEEADDKRPDEMSCEELHNVEPQLLFTNITASTIMCWSYYNVIQGNEVPSEMYFDILKMAVDPKIRKVKN